MKCPRGFCIECGDEHCMQCEQGRQDVAKHNKDGQCPQGQVQSNSPKDPALPSAGISPDSLPPESGHFFKENING